MPPSSSWRDPPVIIDADEILRYLDEVAIARELFRTTDLISTEPYTLPFDNGIITDRVLGIKRIREVNLVPLKTWNGRDSVYTSDGALYQDYGALGSLREALVEVQDVITIETQRTYPTFTVFDTGTTSLTRYAFLIKGGADSKPYVGWLLWGFRGSSSSDPLPTHVEASGGADFFHTQIYDTVALSSYGWVPHVRYERLTYMDTIKANEQVHVIITNAGNYPTVTDFNNSGLFVKATTRYTDDGIVEDSLSYQLPATTPRLYNLLIVQRFAQGNFPNRSIYTIPYRTQ